MSVLASDIELHRLASLSNVSLERTIRKLARARIENTSPQAAKEELHRLLSQTLAMASLLGRRRVVLMVRRNPNVRKHTDPKRFRATQPYEPTLTARFADMISPVVSRVSFEDAIGDLLGRYPTLAPGYKAVQEVYARTHAFALAKSTDDVVTSKVQELLGKSIKQGQGLAKTRDLIQQVGGWSRAYADVVYSTNVSSAYAQGIRTQAEDPEITEVMPAMTYGGRSVHPSRPNHIACVGLIAATGDPLWNTYEPPSGYRCTHSINMVDRWELKERGLLLPGGKVRPFLPPNFSQAGPDKDFIKGTVAGRRGRI